MRHSDSGFFWSFRAVLIYIAPNKFPKNTCTLSKPSSGQICPRLSNRFKGKIGALDGFFLANQPNIL